MSIPESPSKFDSSVLDADNPIPEGFTLIDVRNDDEWEAGHAPGAVHIPLPELPNRLDEVPDGDIIVVCRLGGRSARAADILAEQGIEAWDITDGMTGWQQNGLPMVSEDGDIPTVI